MKNICAILFVLLLGMPVLQAQTATLYSEDFESGGANTWTLNTTDVSSVGSGGTNFYVVNNSYTGGSGSLICLGFPFSYTINNTPAQPGAVTNSPNSYYLHTMSTYGQADNIYSSSFAAADGICIFAENQFAKMTNDINTTGYTGVTLSFYWTCGGGTNIYGEMYYSTNGGTSWNLLNSPVSQYKNQTTWTQATITNAAFDNQATLRFGVRFVNQTSSSAIDPGMSLDDILITGIGTAVNTITTDSVSASSFCPGDPVTVDYTASGSFNAGNIFTAEFSDASGSFAAPIVLGTVSGTASGSISGTIPAGASTGSGYRIRVVSDNPGVIGSDNGTDLTVHSLPLGGTAAAAQDSLCEGDSTLISLSGYSGTISWLYSTDGTNYSTLGNSNASFYALPTGNIWYQAQVSNPNCGSVTSNTVMLTVSPSPSVGALSSAGDSICAGESVSLTVGGAANGTIEWQTSPDGTSWTTAQSGLSTSFNSGPLSSDTYIRVRVYNSCGEDVTTSALYIVVPAPVADFSWTSTGLTVDFTDLSTNSPTSWSWNFGDGATDNQQNPSHTYALSNNFIVTLIVTNSAGCADTLMDTISLTTSIEQALADWGFEAWPNPTEGLLHIGATLPAGESLEISLMDAQGRSVILPELFDGTFRTVMDLSGLSQGLYLLQITGEEGTHTRRILLRE